jgi:tRNA1(Val) A37 N6-methylase TrmN6
VYDVSACAKRLLKNGGRLYLVYPASLLAEAVHALKENRIEPKRIQMVFTGRNAPPHVMLIEAKKGRQGGAYLGRTCFCLGKEKLTKETIVEVS